MNPNAIKKLPKYQVIRSLLLGSLPFAEVMRAFEIFPHEVTMGGEVAAFVYHSRKGRYHIFINECLSLETKEEVLFHELCHIIEDMPEKPYYIGLNNQREEFEKRADLFLGKVMAAYAVE